MASQLGRLVELVNRLQVRSVGPSGALCSTLTLDPAGRMRRGGR